MRLCAIVVFALGSVDAARAPRAADAQTVSPASIVGTVYDSVSGRPLAAAHISLAPSWRETIADSAGAFRLDSVPSGRVTLVIDHPSLDSIGLGGRSTSIVLRPGQRMELRLATPSYSTLW